MRAIDLYSRDPRPINGRLPVSARWLLDHPDVQGYMYRKEAAEFDCEPWRAICGVDRLLSDGRYILEYGSTGEKIVDADYQVYVSIKDMPDCKAA